MRMERHGSVRTGVRTHTQYGKVARIESMLRVLVLGIVCAVGAPFMELCAFVARALRESSEKNRRRKAEAIYASDHAAGRDNENSDDVGAESAAESPVLLRNKAHLVDSSMMHAVELKAEQFYHSAEARAGQIRHSAEVRAEQLYHSAETTAGQIRHSVETSVGQIRTSAAASADQVIHTVENWAHLLAEHKMPEWAQRPFITHGYRQIGMPSREIVMSAFKVHNETGNFWTHFVPGVIFLFAALPYVLFGCLSEESAHDRIFMVVYVLAAASCHTASSVYHLFSCRNEHTFVALCRTDYKAIVSLICASQFPALSIFLLRRHSAWGIGAITALTALWILGIPLMNVFERQKMDAEKNLLMLVMASFGSIVLCLATCAFRAVELSREEVLFLASRTLVMYSAYGLGFAVFGLRLPERWVPGKVNLLGHSHQVWHLCVTVGSSYWFYALLQFYDMGSRLTVTASAISI